MIYIHVPFCQSRCIYCDFYSTVFGPEYREKYVAKACVEVGQRTAELPDAPLRSVYFGGGTPSLLEPRQLERLLEAVTRHCTISPETEITLEGNPDDVTAERVGAWRSLGINRVSLGVQSLHDDTLRLLRRRHTAAQAVEAVDTLVKGGIGNVSIDLIYGLPGQSLAQWTEDLDAALRLPVTHLSSYALSVEEGTALHAMLQAHRVETASDELYLSEYELLMDMAREHHFNHYEVSNFALEGCESRHNSGYWEGVPYVGIGPGAHSYDGRRTRRYNRPDLKEYVADGTGIPHELEHLSLRECFNEAVFTALRTRRGLDVEALLRTYPREWGDDLRKAARSHISGGRLRYAESGRLCLTRSGLFVSDDVMSDFMEVES